MGFQIRHASSKLAFLLALVLQPWCMRASGQTQITIRADSQQAIGGVSQLDRAQFFPYVATTVPSKNTNLGNLVEEIWSSDGLNTSTGRIHSELASFISTGLPEDPNEPGFYDETALRAELQGDYRNDVLNNNRWEPIREQENPILVISGRNGGQWPDFLDGGGPMPTSYEGYADFMNVYYDEVVYGPNAFMPVDSSRFHFEIVNEPQWTSVPWPDVIDLHETVTEQIKEQYPQASIGGASCCGLFNSTNNGWDMAKQLLDDMASWQTPSGTPVNLDFFSIHVYERYDVENDGSYAQATFYSPGHLSGMMDLYESYTAENFGSPIPLSFTEYGSYNQGNDSGSYGSYPRDLQQWDLVRDVREKLMVLIQRPDRILNAVPFVRPKAWQSGFPTHPDGDNVFWEQDANGDWQETIVASMYRMFAPIEGEYLDVASDNVDVQTVAFRDDNKVYLMLNNLEKTSESVNLSTLLPSGSSVTGASIDRIHRTTGVNTFEQGLDVTSSWQNLTLAPEEGAVLTLTLSGPSLYDLAVDKRTFYGDAVDTPLNISGGRSKTVNIGADLEDALTAKVRVSYNREDVAATPGESFFIFLNNNVLLVPTGTHEFDDNDQDVISREVEVPLNFLIDGNNELVADFVGDGGYLISAVLEVTRSIGDFNGSGAFDGEDLSLLADQFGAVSPGSKYDLAGDDVVVDMSDINHWLAQLRGTTAGLGDFDLDDDIDDDDLAIWSANYGSGTHYGQGDFDFDGDVDGLDFLGLQRAFSSYLTASAVTAGSTGLAVPEPTTIMLLLLASGGGILCRTHRRT